ncbi:uncharacterized protein METZ01_LOCUS511424, partial [marine metagenome]
MKPVVHFAHSFFENMRINLGCRYIRMAQHLLNGTQVGASFQKMG